MRIGFTGTRKGWTQKQRDKVWEHLNRIAVVYKDLEIHHGDCVGADSLFHDLCRELFKPVKIIIHPPIDGRWRAYKEGDEVRPPKPFPMRNKNIISESDRLIATPVRDTYYRSGTWSTIKLARTKGIPYRIIGR